jgi:hypothetical protein
MPDYDADRMERACHRCGHSGLCGENCPALLAGDCLEEEMRAENGMHAFSAWFTPEALRARRIADRD